jgi:hypothetical protein
MPYSPDEKRQLALRAGMDPEKWELSDDGNYWNPKQAGSASNEESAQIQGQDNQQKKADESTLGAYWRGAKSSIGPVIGGGGGMALGTMLAPETGGASFLLPILGSLLGSAAGGYTQEGIKKATSTPKELEESQNQEETDTRLHPISKLAGQLTTGLPLFRPSPSAFLQPGGVKNALVASGFGAGTSAADALIHGQAPNMSDMAIGAATAGVMNKPTALGERLLSKPTRVQPTIPSPSVEDNLGPKTGPRVTPSRMNISEQKQPTADSTSTIEVTPTTQTDLFQNNEFQKNLNRELHLGEASINKPISKFVPGEGYLDSTPPKIPDAPSLEELSLQNLRLSKNQGLNEFVSGDHLPPKLPVENPLQMGKDDPNAGIWKERLPVLKAFETPTIPRNAEMAAPPDALKLALSPELPPKLSYIPEEGNVLSREKRLDVTENTHPDLAQEIWNRDQKFEQGKKLFDENAPPDVQPNPEVYEGGTPRIENMPSLKGMNIKLGNESEAGGGKALGMVKEVYDKLIEVGQKVMQKFNEFGPWVDEMIRLHGGEIRPYLQKVWEHISNTGRISNEFGQPKENIVNRSNGLLGNIFNSATDNIAKVSPGGEHVAGKLNLYRNLQSDYRKWQNLLLEKSTGIRGELYPRLIKDSQTGIDTIMNDPSVPQEQKNKIIEMRQVFKDIHEDRRKNGQLVQEASGKLRQAEDSPTYFPHMMNAETREILQHPGTPEFDKIKAQWKAFDPSPEGEARFKKFVEIFGGDSGSTSHFGALMREAGKGLPKEWIEPDLQQALSNYGSRVAKGAAYHDAIESDPHTMHLLGKATDAYGRPTQLPSNEKPLGVFGELRANKDVQSVMNQIEGKGLADRNDVVQAMNRVATALVLGPVSEIRDFIGTASMMLKFVGPSELPGLVKHLAENRMSVKKAYDVGLARRDMSTLFDLTEAHSKLATQISGFADKLQKTFQTGRLEAYTRAMALSMGEYASKTLVAKAKLGDRLAIQALKELNPGTNWEKVPLQTIAKRMAESARGHYDYSHLPNWANNSSLSPFFRLSRYHIEQTNQFIKFAINPALEGNVTPLVMSLTGGLLAGEAIKSLYELTKNRKLNVADLEEIAKSDRGFTGNGLATVHYLSTVASYSAIGGILSDLTKISMDAISGDVKNEGFNYVLNSVTGRVGEQLAAGISALIDGEPVTEVLPALSKDILRNISQIGQVSLANYARLYPASDTGKDFQRARENRDLNVYQKLSGQVPGGGPTFTPNYKKQSEEAVRKAETPEELLKVLPGGVKRAVDRNLEGGPEKVQSALQEMSRGKRTILPNPQRNPQETAGFINWYGKVHGQEAMTQRMMDYQKLQGMNQARKAVLGL